MNTVPIEVFAMICLQMTPRYIVRLRAVCHSMLTKLATLGLTDASSCPINAPRVGASYAIGYRHWSLFDREYVYAVTIHFTTYRVILERVGKYMVLILNCASDLNVTRYLYTIDDTMRYTITITRSTRLHALSSPTYITIREYVEAWSNYLPTTVSEVHRPSLSLDYMAERAFMRMVAQYPGMAIDQVALMEETAITLANL